MTSEYYRFCLFCCKICEIEGSSSNGFPLVGGGDNVQKFLSLFGGYLGKSVHLVHEDHGKFDCCENCLTIINRFSDLCEQLKCLEKEIEWKVGSILGIMTAAGKVPSRIKLLEETGFDKMEGLVGGMADKRVQGCRQEIIQTCSLHLLKSFPREPTPKQGNKGVVVANDFKNLVPAKRKRDVKDKEIVQPSQTTYIKLANDDDEAEVKKFCGNTRNYGADEHTDFENLTSLYTTSMSLSDDDDAEVHGDRQAVYEQQSLLVVSKPKSSIRTDDIDLRSSTFATGTMETIPNSKITCDDGSPTGTEEYPWKSEPPIMCCAIYKIKGYGCTHPERNNKSILRIKQLKRLKMRAQMIRQQVYPYPSKLNPNNESDMHSAADLLCRRSPETVQE